MGLGKIKDAIVLKLALRWLGGKIKNLRGKDKESGMGKFLKFLDGWKLVIGVLVLTAVKVYDGLTNGHAGAPVELALTMFGYNPSAALGVDFAQLAGAITVVIGIGHKVVKAQTQARAGATASELLGPEGQLKLAVSQGKAVPIEQ